MTVAWSPGAGSVDNGSGAVTQAAGSLASALTVGNRRSPFHRPWRLEVASSHSSASCCPAERTKKGGKSLHRKGAHTIEELSCMPGKEAH